MGVDWKAPDAFTRLLAAVLAVHLAADSDKYKIDYKKVATCYGRGATYDAVEGKFRSLRSLATQMRHEMDSGVIPLATSNHASSVKDESFNISFASEDGPGCVPVTPTKRGRKPKVTPKKEGGVIDGRVSKTNTPTKNRSNVRGGNVVNGMKEETASSEESTAGSKEEEVAAKIEIGNDSDEQFPEMDYEAAFGANNYYEL